MIIQLLGGQSRAPALVRQHPYSVLVTEAQIAPAVTPLAATVIFTPAAGFSYFVMLRNASAGAQTIRVGNAPTYAGPDGFLLTPGDNWAAENIAIQMSAMASAANALLDVIVWRTA